MLVFKGYRWTVLDLTTAVGVVIFLIWLGLEVVNDAGVSLASMASAFWAVGTLGFMFLYPLPIFGGSVESEKLLSQDRETYTREEAKIVLEQKRHKSIDRSVLIRFAIFFCGTGGLALVGFITNT